LERGWGRGERKEREGTDPLKTENKEDEVRRVVGVSEREGFRYLQRR